VSYIKGKTCDSSGNYTGPAFVYVPDQTKEPTKRKPMPKFVFPSFDKYVEEKIRKDPSLKEALKEALKEEERAIDFNILEESIARLERIVKAGLDFEHPEISEELKDL
jgi:hypothetical protein